MTTQWKYAGPKKHLAELTKLFGKPDIFDGQVGGLALWLRKSLKKKKLYGLSCCFEEILIRDESISHRCPKKHTDFLYSYVLVDISAGQLPILQSISGSIAYDPLKRLLSARCGSIGANIATLKLATDLLTDQIDYSKYTKLANLYRTYILSTQDQETVETLYQGLCTNLKTLGEPNALDYWTGAFSADCSDPASDDQWWSVCSKPDKIGLNLKKLQQGLGRKRKSKPDKASLYKNKPNKDKASMYKSKPNKDKASLYKSKPNKDKASLYKSKPDKARFYKSKPDKASFFKMMDKPASFYLNKLDKPV